MFAFKDDSVYVGVRGPVSVHSAFSVLPVSIDSMQITKSVNSETKEKKSSDTMGMKHKIYSALYVIKGRLSPACRENGIQR